MSRRKYSTPTAIAIVIANVVGTGVFTSLGFQLLEIRSTFVLLALWLVGGLMALCGALTYAELGSRLPRSGGEYNFLTEIYHPAAGFVAGWVSATVGFAAPTALVAMTFGAYLEAALEWQGSDTLLAVCLVLALTGLHGWSRRSSSGSQGLFTLLKILMILAFSALVLALSEAPQAVRLLPAPGDGALLVSGAFAVALIYVNYAYTGWNSATYITSELEAPEKRLPLILFAATLVILCLYLLLNYVFLYGAPMDALAGRLETGLVVAQHAFGDTGGRLMGLALAMLLVSTASAMVIAGPRVLQVIGEDFRIFAWLSRRNQQGIPVAAIGFQSAVTLFFVLTSTFEQVLVFSSFVMGICSFCTVAGIFLLRWRQPDRPGYRVWAYPLPPLVFMALMGWTLAYIFINRPEEAQAGLLLLAAGWVCYLGAALSRRRSPATSSTLR